MKILEVKPLQIPEIKVIGYARFIDRRGFFTEVYRKSDFDTHPQTDFLRNKEFVQANGSYSKKGAIRGLHFQWDPPMDKLIRVVTGSMVDLALDIRKGSPTFGKIISYEMSPKMEADHNEWIWVPNGFAHGSIYLSETYIEYFCTAEWNPEGEASISPFAPDIEWSLCDPLVKKQLDRFATTELVTEKDRNGFTLSQWERSTNSNNFTYHAS
ncbi:dTDP-4-dehydrorhamnose 3,5-epimerase family protein [Candidatus Roizmanbacteria bacterium]|nr:dTDP-4-dehydrorhamnose 3,5-epimerase family protein [Candidatus Roizmanbacteria bacterium]